MCGFSLSSLYSWKIRLKKQAEPLVLYPDPLAEPCETGLVANLEDIGTDWVFGFPHQPPSEKVCGPFPDYTWPYLLLLLSWMDLASQTLFKENTLGSISTYINRSINIMMRLHPR